MQEKTRKSEVLKNCTNINVCRVGDKGRGSSLQERVSHTYTLKLD